MPDLDTELASVLRQAKAKPMHFAFVAKGASDGRLLAGKLPVPAKAVNQAKADLRGGQVFKGRCFGEDGQMIFEVPKAPPGTLANQLKKVISLSTGLMLRVEVRINQELEKEENTPPAPEEATPPPPPPVRPMETNGSTKPASPPPVQKPVEIKGDLVKRLKALVGKYQAAVARKGPQTPVLVKLFGAFQASLGQNKLELATKALTELERLVAQVLAAPAVAPAADAGQARWQKRLATLTPTLKQVLQRGGPDLPSIKQLFAQASAFSQKKDFAQANAFLDRLEPLVQKALAAGGGGTGKGPASAATPARTLEVWQKAKDQADAQLNQLQAAMRRTGYVEIGELAEEMAAVLQKFRTGLIPALMEFDQAAPEKRDAARARARQAVANHQNKLAADRHILAADTNPFGVPVNIRETLGQALATLAATLAA